MEKQPQSKELTIPIIKEYMADIEKWYKRFLNHIRTPDGVLPSDFGTEIRDISLNIARRENPRLIPLILAQYSTDPKLVPVNTSPVAVGNPLTGEKIGVTGHISDSTLWLVDKDQGKLQTMIRLAVKEGGRPRLIDVYSDPVYLYKKTQLGNTFNIDETEVSRSLRLLKYVEDNNLEVLGWIPIEEVETHKIPSYSK